VAAVGGVAIFSTLSIDQPGTGYDLTAGASGLSPATSSAFDIVPSTPPVSDGQSTVSVSPATITASNGASASSITVTAKDANGNVVSGVNVTLSATGNGNTVTQPAGPTDGNGVATGALASTVAGSKTVTAVAGGVTLTQQPVVTVTASAPDAAQSTVSASPTTIAAGSGSSTLAVTAKDAFGNRISGAAVVLDATGTGNSLTQPNGPTNASGEATGSLASTDAEVKTVSATVDGTPVTQTAAVTVTPPAGAGIVHTLLTSGNNVVNQKIYTTASIAPAPSTLITVAVVGHNSTSAPGSPTVSGGGMSAWTEVTSVSFDSLSDLHKRVTIFRALSTGPGSGPITITFPVNVSNCQWIVSQWSGVDLSGTNGSGAIVQSASNRADGVNSLSVGLAPLGSFTNVAYGVVGVNGNGLVVSPGAGFEEIAEQSSGESPRSVLEAEWVAGDNTVNATWSGLLKAGILGVELKAAGGP
jgi:hypothetical protein